MENHELLGVVKFGATMRGDQEVPDEFILRAIQLAEERQVEVARYPTGVPSAKSLYEVANLLYSASRN